VAIPLLTGKVLFNVQGVQAERAAGLPTVFQTNLVNPQATTTNRTTAATTGVHMSSGDGTANHANTNHKLDLSPLIYVGGAIKAVISGQCIVYTICSPHPPGTNKGVSTTTTTHNTADNDALFGTFFQTAGKTTSTAKTNNAFACINR
jgi:hypothetical protein